MNSEGVALGRVIVDVDEGIQCNSWLNGPISSEGVIYCGVPVFVHLGFMVLVSGGVFEG